MLTKEEETLIILMGYRRCRHKHIPAEGGWTNEPHWIIPSSVGDNAMYVEGIIEILYGK